MAAFASALRSVLQVKRQLAEGAAQAGRRAALLAAGALLLGTGLASPASALTSTQRLDLKVLLLSADGTEPTLGAWATALRREGVPFDTIVANNAPPIDAATLSDGASHGYYQAVVLATGGLLQCDLSPCYSAMSDTEWAALNAYETAFGVRRVTAYTYPSPSTVSTGPMRRATYRAQPRT